MPGKYIKRKVDNLPKGRFHCEFCGQLLAKGSLKEGGWIEIKCRKCNRFNTFEKLKLGA